MNYRIISFIILAFLIVSCTKKVSIKNNIEPQTIIVGEYSYNIKKKSNGIDKKLKEMMGVDFENIDYSIVVTSNKDNKIIQEIVFEDKTDRLISINIDNQIFNNLIKVKFCWNKFTTSPVGYVGYKYFKIIKDTGNLELVFFYFEHIIVSEADPRIELINLKINENILELNYKFYESSMFPEVGEGTINVYYTLNNSLDNIIYDNLNSEILKKANFKSPGILTPIKINPPINVIYTKDEINNKFNIVLNNYKLFY